MIPLKYSNNFKIDNHENILSLIEELDREEDETVAFNIVATRKESANGQIKDESTMSIEVEVC